MLNAHARHLLFTGRTRRRFTWAIVGSAVAALAEACGVLIILPLMQLLTDTSRTEGLLGLFSRALGRPSDDRLALYLTIMTFAAFLSKGALSIVIRWWVLGFVYRQEAETSVRLLRHYLSAPYGLHLRRNSAEMIRTMNDATSQVYSQVVVGTMSAIAESLTIIAVSAGLFALMPLPALAVSAYLLVAGLTFHRLVRRRAKAAGDRMIQSFTSIYQAALQALGGIKEIKVRRKTEYFLGRFSEARMRHARSRRVATFLGELPKYVFEILFIVGIGLMTVIVFGTSESGQAVSIIALFTAAGFRVLPGIVRLLTALNQMRVGSRALDIVLVDIEAATESEHLTGSSPAISANDRVVIHSEVAIDHVTFAYESSPADVVRDVSFVVPVGSAVALVGASGSGKSTLIDITLGLHTARSGGVVVDGVDIATMLPLWQQSIGMVPQDVYLLDDSLRANIAFGEWPDEIDEDRVRSAVAKAQLDELVASMPEGLDTFVGERGVRLSGGQRQRIGIARALYAQPQLLILDEATSALDNETESRITQTIQSLHGEMTILIVAHRLSTVRHCDQLVFLKEGAVAAVGTFEEVRGANADFAHLASLGSLA